MGTEGGWEMTRDDIIRMARETGMISDSHASGMISFLERFAALIAVAEREACAQIADEWATCEQKQFGNGGPGSVIRARGAK